MPKTRDIGETTGANDDDALDPREAARLLAQAEREARRQFNRCRDLLAAELAVEPSESIQRLISAPPALSRSTLVG